jgi:nucleotide-binding universal stress UspA family protein
MSGVSKTLLVPALKNILFPTDFSESSQAAIPFLRTIAERYDSTIHLVHVIAPEPMLEIPLDSLPELDADFDVAQTSMKTLLASKVFGNTARTATVGRGQLWKVLAASTEEKSIDLIRVRHTRAPWAEEVGARLRSGTGFPPGTGPHCRPPCHARRNRECKLWNDSVRNRFFVWLPARAALCGVAGAG